MAKEVGYRKKFNESLLRIPEALEWAEKQNVDRLRRFFIENANIPLYCFSSGGASSALEYASLLYETNQGMSKALTPLMMASISDEALKRSKILIVTGDGDGCDEKYTSKNCAGAGQAFPGGRRGDTAPTVRQPSSAAIPGHPYRRPP